MTLPQIAFFSENRPSTTIGNNRVWAFPLTVKQSNWLRKMNKFTLENKAGRTGLYASGSFKIEDRTIEWSATPMPNGVVFIKYTELIKVETTIEPVVTDFSKQVLNSIKHGNDTDELIKNDLLITDEQLENALDQLMGYSIRSIQGKYTLK